MAPLRVVLLLGWKGLVRVRVPLGGGKLTGGGRALE
jgi:hypothetical protein